MLFVSVLDKVSARGDVLLLHQLEDGQDTLRVDSKELTFWVHSMIAKAFVDVLLHLYRILYNTGVVDLKRDWYA
jgi:hypothetical protein